MAEKLTYEEAQALAKQEYVRGGDFFYECVERNEYVPATKAQLLREFKRCRDIDDDITNS